MVLVMGEMSSGEFPKPIGSEYPQLESLELRRAEEIATVPFMDNATPSWVGAKLESNPDFKARITALEQGFDQLAHDGELTNDRIMNMLEYQFLGDAVTSTAERYEQRFQETGNFAVVVDCLSAGDADFCAYLDMALPFDEHASVSHTPILDWTGYVRIRAVDRAESGTDGIVDIKPPEPPKTPEERVAALRKAHMDDARKYVKRTLAIAGVGVAALLGAEFVVPQVTDVQAVQDTLHTGGVITTGFAGLRFLALASRLAYGYEDRQRLARRLQYPAFDMSKLAESRTLIAADSTRSSRELRASNPYETSWTGSADLHALKTVVSFMDLLIGGGQQNIDIFCDTVARRMDTYLNRNPEDNYDKRVADQVFRLLDQHLPIYASDTVVPRDELTGEKTWRCFIKKYLAAQKATDSKE